MRIKPVVKVAVCIYFFLTFIRFFTGLLNDQREENPTLILRAQPCVEYDFWGTDEAITAYEAKYNWYQNKAYVELLHMRHNLFLEYAYYALIMLWEFTTLLILVTIIVMLVVLLIKRLFVNI